MDMMTDKEGLIFKIKRFSLHDGPGIRTSVFLKGCPMSCIWCHSPEGITREITIWNNSNTCIECGTCVDACPNKALSLSGSSEEKIKIDRERCDLSGLCLQQCPTGSLQYTGRKVSVESVIEEIEKDMIYYKDSGGGVTLTGGEPTAQPDFAFSILDRCCKKDVNTAVETSLYCEREILKKFAEVTSLFIVDIKILDPVQHKIYTGVSNELILDNFRFLSGKGENVIVRIPLVPGITDSMENLGAITEFVKAINPSAPLELIKFNYLASNNYRKLNLPYLVK
jgi:pyruvate formate lyase activating enzyme